MSGVPQSFGNLAADSSAAPPAWKDFQTDAERVLHQLRTALSEVVASVPGRVSKPTDLQRALRVDLNVCCKVLKAISTPGVLPVGLHLPGIIALRSFLKAARKAGVREAAVDAAMKATDAFNDLVSTHADDRTTFDSMLSSLVVSEDAANITFQHRRATARGQAHLFGMQARAQFKCLLVQPSAQDPGMLDLANLTGFISLRLWRPARAPIVLTPAYTTNDDGSTTRSVRREPLGPVGDHGAGATLIPEFCEGPGVQLREVPTTPGRVLGELVGVGIGNKAAVTCVEGHLNRAAVPRYKDPGNKIGGHLAEIRVPCDSLFLDLLVREDTFGPLRPTVHMCADHLAELRAPGASAWQPLEPYESVEHLGKGASVLYTPEYPRYPELGRHAFDRLGWDAERFDVYRCRVEYPVLPSTVAMFFDLPEAPSV
jgi:hypothetical protein